jgi:hypothetical protein
MGAAGAFLGQVQIVIEVNGFVRAGVDAALAAGALNRINDYQPIFSLIDRTINFAGRHAGGIRTMIAEEWIIGYLDSGYLPSNGLGQLQPELAGIRLRFSIRGPVIGDMLILAGDLAVVAAIADRTIMNKYFHFISLLQPNR